MPLDKNPPLEIVRQAATWLMRRLPQHVRYDDLYSAGLLALVEAGERYDVGRGTEFEAYAAQRVKGAMLDMLRREDLLTRRRRSAIRDGVDDPEAPPPPTRVDVAAADEVADEVNVEEQVDTIRLVQRVRQAVAMLDTRLRTVYELRFEQGLTMLEIGSKLGVTDSCVSRRINRLQYEVGLKLGIQLDTAALVQAVQDAD